MDFNIPFNFYYMLYDPNKSKQLTGIMTPNYLYKHRKFDVLDDILDPYRRVIIFKWGMYNYTDPKYLNREEIMDAINIRGGADILNSIYLLRFIPSVTLGPKMKELLSDCRIFKLNLNDIKIDKFTNNSINWGWDVKIPRKLNRMYYDQVTYDEYVRNYRENILYNKIELFSHFNRVQIKINDGIIPIDLIEEVTSSVNLHR